MFTVKKVPPKLQKHFAACCFFFSRETFSHFGTVRWGFCEGYMDVFRWEVFSIVLVLYSVDVEIGILVEKYPPTTFLSGYPNVAILHFAFLAKPNIDNENKFLEYT
jgi:hypothetical protein